MEELIHKYNVPGPRYTSYPTVPYWATEGIGYQNWIDTVRRAFKESNEQEGISIYIHLPFCESLCTFCGCHKRITKRHSVEAPYIDLLLKEWDMYLALWDQKPVIKELHLGGGTPTFFSPYHLEKLIQGILETSILGEAYEFSFEAHPNNTTPEHLGKLFQLGFRRNSFGVQDYDPIVQEAINRKQSFQAVEKVTQQSRRLGYTSVSHDLVFGLPFQSLTSIEDTITKTGQLKPDRISFYSYAHVPWIKGVGQRGYDEKNLPSPALKRQMYELGKELLSEIGYLEIGMDHFSLETDSLFQSAQNKKLHRNFMGYTASKTHLMIGLGMSAISDSWYGFAQNAKSLEDYTYLLTQGRIPIQKGHLLSDEDLLIRKHILNIMCHFETSWKNPKMQFPELKECLKRLQEMESDGLVNITKTDLSVPLAGRPFLRNICMAFDLRLIRNRPSTQIFSMTI